MPISKISQAGLDAPLSLTSPTLTTPNIDSAQIPTVSGTAPLYMCRAWVNFNGEGTVAIRASGNVSSITDNGTGDYTINFTTAMPDANYSFVASAAAQYTNSLTLYAGQDANDTRSTTQLNFKTIYNNASTVATDDSPNVNVAVFR